MKKKKHLNAKKVLLYVVITIIVIVGLLVLNANQLQKTPYSFKNTGFFGNALYYDTLEVLGYNVSYEITSMSQLDSQGLIVVNVASASIEESDYELLFNYVQNGGKILVTSSDPYNLQIPEVLNETQGEFGPFTQWTSPTEGVLLYGDIGIFNNINVSNDREATYETLKILHPFIDKEGIVFNEYYLFVNEGKRSLWREIPTGIKFILYQLLLTCLFYIGYKGKRFGAPQKLYEELEPDEHQYAKAVGELYYQAGHWEVLIDAYYHQLLNKIYRKYLLYTDINESNWIKVFEHNKHQKTAIKVYQFMKQYNEGTYNDYTKKKRNKKIKEMLIHIQNLEKSMDQ